MKVLDKYRIITGLIVILLLIDKFNIITNVYYRLENTIIYLIIVSLVIYTFIEIIDKKMWNLLFNKYENEFDILIEISLLSLVGYNLIKVIYSSKLNTYIFDLELLLILIIVLRKLIVKLCINENIQKYNTVELEDLYNNKFGNKDQSIIILNEKDVEYDMLKRNTIINMVYNTIKELVPKTNFRIGLYGEWGSGKTTIINNVLNKLKLNNKKDYIIIRNFEPWLYESKESLFEGIYREIISELNNEKCIGNYKKLFLKYKQLIFDVLNKKYGLNINNQNTITVSKIKSSINKLLIKNNKKIIFIIDNIDRLNKESIDLIFKTVTTILDLDNIIYLLSFDRKRIDNIFENELNKDKEYLEKIINCEIEVPIIDNSIITDIAVKSITNLLNYYDRMENIDNGVYTENIYRICKDFRNLRQVKRFLNTLSITFNNNELHYLNDLDMLLIEYLRFKDANLYTQIKDNPKFFISEDRGLRSDTMLLGDTYNKEAKAFFENIIPKDELIQEILKYLFPNVVKYLSRQDIINTGFIITGDWIKKEKIKNILNRRIFSARYFELYFMKCDNMYTNINIDVNKIISQVNNGEKDKSFFQLAFDDISNKYNDNQKELIEVFTYNVINENIDIKKEFIKSLSDNILKYDTVPIFFGFNANRMAISSIYDILTTLIEDEVISIVTEIINTVDNIEFIDNILYYIKPHDKRDKNFSESAYNELKAKFQYKLNNIIDIGIDIVNDNKYGYKNIWTLNKYIEDMSKLKKYLKSILKTTTIFKFLYNFVGESTGTNGYGYIIKKEDIEIFISLEEIDSLLEKIDYELNEQQKNIIEIYKISKGIETPENNFDKAIYRKTPIKFDKLIKE